MTPYQAAQEQMKAQLNTLMAFTAARNPDFDPNSTENKEKLQHMILSEALSMIVGAFVRLQAFDDVRNDQSQASLRECIRTLGQRLEINVEEKLGVPIAFEDQL